MLNYDTLLSDQVKKMKPSGIRKFFDLAAMMEGVISLGVGEQDFQTPWMVRKAAVDSLERKRMVYDILRRMNISHRAKHFPQQLSGGQQQRVAIARAVVTNPKLILADEPTGNLDSKNGAEVMNLLTELNREGTTIVMVTHSRHDASFAHRTVHLFDGSVVASVASNDL